MMTLTCVTAKTPQYYIWKKDGSQIRQSSKTLNIPSSRMKDSGDYQCGVGDDDLSSSVQMEVNDNAYLILQAPSTVVEGDSLDVRCHSWQSNEDAATSFYRNNEVIASTTTLHFPQVNSTMSGTYKCEKKFTYANRRTSAEEYIYVQDLFTTPKINSLSFIKEGENLTLTCDTRLNPLRGGTELNFAFYRDGQTVREFSRYDTYKVWSAHLEDSGNYTCEARKGSGTVKKTSDGSYIQIYEPVSGVTITADKDNKDLVFGESLILNCSIEKGSSTEFQWWHNGSLVDKDSEVYELQDNGMVLYIESLQSHHVGTYLCEVRYNLPAQSVTATFQILEVLENPPLAISALWPVLGVLAVLLLLAAIFLFINRNRLYSIFPSVNRHQNQQHSDTTFDKDDPRDGVRSANECTDRQEEGNKDPHLYDNGSEGDVLYSYITINNQNGRTHQSDEPSVVYSVLQRPGQSAETPLNMKTDDIYQNVNAK